MSSTTNATTDPPISQGEKIPEEHEKLQFQAPVEWDSTHPTIKTLKGNGGNMSIIGMRVQQFSNDFKSYCRFMKEQEEKLVKDIKLIQ